MIRQHHAENLPGPVLQAQCYRLTDMSYRLDFDGTHRVLRTRLFGAVTDSDMTASFAQTREKIAVLYPRAGVLHFADIVEVQVHSRTIAHFAKAAPLYPLVPAFIVAPSDLVFGMSRMFQILSDESRPYLQVVRTMGEVKSALAVSEFSFQPIED